MRGGVARAAADDAAVAQVSMAGLPSDWPNRDASRCVDAAGLRWHVQCAGAGPVLLLLHGTGSATNTWRDLLPRLASRFTIVAPDLPGHGFTSAMPVGRARLPDIAHAVAGLLQALALAPAFVAGHSAGAAIGARLALAGEMPAIARLAFLAGALRPLDGLAGAIGSPLASLLSRSTLATRLAAWRAGDEAAVRRFIEGTGSTLDARGVSTYRTLLRRRGHIAGALAMMAGWDLVPLRRALADLDRPVLLVHGDDDRTVPPVQSADLLARLRDARLARLPGLGHLAHEERPAEVAQLLADWFAPA